MGQHFVLLSVHCLPLKQADMQVDSSAFIVSYQQKQRDPQLGHKSSHIWPVRCIFSIDATLPQAISVYIYNGILSKVPLHLYTESYFHLTDAWCQSVAKHILKNSCRRCGSNRCASPVATVVSLGR